jgi:hypothetical protein
MIELPNTIPETLRRELETPLSFRGRCNPADLWPYFKAWLVKDGLVIRHRDDEQAGDKP